MICQRMMVGSGGGGGSSRYDEWSFTVNTEATSSGEKKTGIPLNLYNQQDVSVDVDWGDGTFSTLTSADYTVDSSLASVHEYSIPGVYTITLGSRDWDGVRLLMVYLENINNYISLNDATAPIYYMQRTLISLDSPIVQVLGMNQVYGRSGTSISSTVFDNSLRLIFFRCAKLSSIAPEFFSKLLYTDDLYCMFAQCIGITSLPTGFLSGINSVRSTHYLFFGCTKLSSLPSNFFIYSSSLHNMVGTFTNCSALGDFDITISATGVTDATSFVTAKSGTNRIIRVPSGSITETTFNAVASSLGLTIIGE